MYACMNQSWCIFDIILQFVVPLTKMFYFVFMAASVKSCVRSNCFLTPYGVIITITMCTP